jgi:tetratricopeptide (TPR) repeat protein
MIIPTYLDVLHKANEWRATNTPEALKKAAEVLQAGMEEYDDSLPLGDELVLVLKVRGDLDGAINVLRQLDRKFKQVGEETLCRWGSVLKLRANIALGTAGLGAAEMDYRDSERYYARAYDEHHTFYPRINQLSVRFVRAGLAKQLGPDGESDKLLASVQEDAKTMLTDSTMWRLRKHDDSVWSAASRGEAWALLGKWPAAEAGYIEALRAANRQQFYHDCMMRQMRDVLIPAFARLSIQVEGLLAKPEEFFKC